MRSLPVLCAVLASAPTTVDGLRPAPWRYLPAVEEFLGFSYRYPGTVPVPIITVIMSFVLLLAALAAGSLAAGANAPCADMRSGCGSWADSGECEKNPDFMRDACPEACGVCTVPPMLA